VPIDASALTANVHGAGAATGLGRMGENRPVGYCHYYGYDLTNPQFDSVWPKIVEDTERIITRVRDAGIPIGNTRAGNPRWAGVEVIAFDGGDSDDLGGPGPVIFRVVPPTYWQQPRNGSISEVIKTARLPYDLAVTAVLLRCHMLLPAAFAIHSDGAWDEEWLYGATGPIPGGLGARAVVAELFGDAPTACPFDRERALLL